MDDAIEVKHIKAYVQQNGIIRMEIGKNKDLFLARLNKDIITYDEIEKN